MKKANRLLAVLFAADLLALTNYREAVDSIARTFSFDEVLFYWFYLIPAAYLLGGYFLGQLLLLKGSVRLNGTVKKGISCCCDGSSCGLSGRRHPVDDPQLFPGTSGTTVQQAGVPCRVGLQ